MQRLGLAGHVLGWLCAGTIAAFTTEAAASDSFVLFESGQVRPLALSPSGRLLFAVNTPDNRLEVFLVLPGTLQHLDSVPVGLEPVAVAPRSETEVWPLYFRHACSAIACSTPGGQFG